MPSEEFFSRLPGRLSGAEAELRGHLLKAAEVARRVLPSDNSVSLQEWVERRLPGELALVTNSRGLVELHTEKAQAAAAAPLQGLSRTLPLTAVSKAGATVKSKGFLDGLPSDAFTDAETGLRDALTAVLRSGPLELTKVVLNAGVSSCVQALLAGTGVSLMSWIERRVGEEVLIFTDAKGRQMCRLPSVEDAAQEGNSNPVTRVDLRDAFFASLPTDSFTKEEEVLRNTIFSFLALWPSKDLAALHLMGADPAVAAAKKALIAKAEGVNFSLRSWIDSRIGQEISLTQNGAVGNIVIHLLPAGVEIVQNRLREMQRPVVDRRRPDPEASFNRNPEAELLRQQDKELEQQRSEQAKNSFFEGLPTDELLPAEIQLREALIAFIKDWPTNGKMGSKRKVPTLSLAGPVEAIRNARLALLPKEVSFKQWIEKRVGGEIITRTAEDGQVEMTLPDSNAEEAVPSVEEDSQDDRLRMHGDRVQKKEDFFDHLPSDGFTDAEERLREAVLKCLEGWPCPPAMSMSHLGGDAAVRDARREFLPPGCGASMKEWVERRIGAEVETWQQNLANAEVSICLAGQREDAMSAAGSGIASKRKQALAAAPGGYKGSKGKGNGKGKGKGKSWAADPAAKKARRF